MPRSHARMQLKGKNGRPAPRRRAKFTAIQGPYYLVPLFPKLFFKLQMFV